MRRAYRIAAALLASWVTLAIAATPENDLVDAAVDDPARVLLPTVAPTPTTAPLALEVEQAQHALLPRQQQQQQSSGSSSSSLSIPQTAA